MQCWFDVKASASSSGSPWLNKKRRRKSYPVVLGKSRGRDRTVLPNLSNANEYSLASEQGPILDRAQAFGVRPQAPKLDIITSTLIIIQ